ncbi:MAG: hypothetical protein R2711_02395 [Acidimicrobiales bacterium]
MVEFHWAMVRSGSGMVTTGTNVGAVNVMGNKTAKAMPVTPSGVPTTLPSSTPIQIMANEKAIIST